eukprot:jgi/Astpho2/9509/Aster-x0393
MRQMDLRDEGRVGQPAFVASQLDWRAFQRNYKDQDQWLEYAAIAFSTLDADTNGRISAADLMRMLGSKLPEHEVEYAVEDALVDAGYADADNMDFEGFLKLLRVAVSIQSLSLFMKTSE